MSVPLSGYEKELLFNLAHQTLEEAVLTGGLAPWSPEGLPGRLLEKSATFVTLYHLGKLRGCVGVIEAQQSLAGDVRQHTMAAAFHDPRFARVQPEELPGITIEISILSPLQEVVYQEAADLLGQIRPGLDGVLIMRGERRATFLPKVWEKIKDSRVFLNLLCDKMGVPEDTWRLEHLKVYIYQTEDLRN